MDALRFDRDDEVALPTARPASNVPLWAVMAMSVAACALAALVRSYVPALITYAALLLLGCGLLFYRRRLAIRLTRQAGGIGYVSISFWERLALASLAVACLANGIVIALEVASWDRWSR